MRLFVVPVLFELAQATVLFVSAGRLDLPWFWAVIGSHAAIVTSAYLAIGRDLLRERFKPAPGGKDRNLRRAAAPFYLAHLIIAGLDVGRFHWSPPLPVPLQAAALLMYVAGLSIATWAMASNPFFSPVVRIQTERGHHLVATGPYRFIRHPGYTGWLLSSLIVGFALGSPWSVVPLIPLLFLLLKRTLIEDQFLRKELDGYTQYAQQVRYRMVPGVW
jgi:protein-S-isoprenylcysteine O-methyltransferase Ste14